MQGLERQVFGDIRADSNCLSRLTFALEVFEGMMSLCCSLRVRGIGDHLLNHKSHAKGRDGTPTLTHLAHPIEAHKWKPLQTGQQRRIQLFGALPFVAAPRGLVLGPQGTGTRLV